MHSYPFDAPQKWPFVFHFHCWVKHFRSISPADRLSSSRTFDGAWKFDVMTTKDGLSWGEVLTFTHQLLVKHQRENPLSHTSSTSKLLLLMTRTEFEKNPTKNSFKHCTRLCCFRFSTSSTLLRLLPFQASFFLRWVDVLTQHQKHNAAHHLIRKKTRNGSVDKQS